MFTCNYCHGKFDHENAIAAGLTLYCPNCYSQGLADLDAMNRKAVKNATAQAETPPETGESETRWYIVLFSHYSKIDVRWDFTKVYYRAKSARRAAAAATGRMVHRWQHGPDGPPIMARGGINVLVSVYAKNGGILYTSTVADAWSDVRAVEPSWLDAEPEPTDHPCDGCGNIPYESNDCDYCRINEMPGSPIHRAGDSFFNSPL